MRKKSVSYLKKPNGSIEVVGVKYESETSDYMSSHAKSIQKNENRPSGQYIDSKELSSRTREALAIKEDADSVNFRKKK